MKFEVINPQPGSLAWTIDAKNYQVSGSGNFIHFTDDDNKMCATVAVAPGLIIRQRSDL